MLAPGSSTRLVGALPVGAVGAARIFAAAYPALRPALLGRSPGALIAVLDAAGAVLGQIWIRARAERPRCAVVGRHPRCAVAVTGADELSLRHLAVLVGKKGGEVSVRMLDLLSGWGFYSESGAALEAITTDGSGFFQIGPLLVALLLTGPARPWPGDPAAAFAALPPRTLDGLPPGAQVQGPQRLPRVVTNVRPMEGPMRFPVESPRESASETGLLFVRPQDLDESDAPEDELLRDRRRALARALAGERPRGALIIQSADSVERVLIGDEALDRGVLLGRHDRCADRGSSALSDPSLSRVHLLVTRSEDQVLAYDTASSNGSFLGSLPVNGAPLVAGRRIRLGPAAAWVRWEQA